VLSPNFYYQPAAWVEVEKEVKVASRVGQCPFSV